MKAIAQLVLLWAFLTAVRAFYVQQAAGGTVHYVSQTGSVTSPYTNWATAASDIQSAVNACSDSDTVLITNGTYKLSSRIVINQPITLQSVNG